jgi:hypothetical protein
MSLLDTLLDEYEKIADTEFWKVYVQKLRDRRNFEIRKLTQEPDLSKLPSMQGAIRAYEWVEGLPKVILESLQEK